MTATPASTSLRFFRSCAAGMLLLAVLPAGLAEQTALISAGSAWKYLDDGTNQGTLWRSPGFDDATWDAGPAQLGYGDGDEATVVSYGPNANNKYVTTYFRHAFEVTDPKEFAAVLLRVLRDDGAVTYLNGVEVFRTNMPAGTVGHLTLASSAVGGAEESAFFEASISPADFQAGTNYLAVEIHQSSRTSSDISFDLELIASDSPFVTRGPYLQRGTPDGVVIRWRTNPASDSRVWYGDAPGNLTMMVDDPTPTTEHEVALSGLSPDTRYYYAVGTSTDVLAGDDNEHSFTTAPPPGPPRSTRVWAIGDSGTADANAAAVRDAYLAYAAGATTDVWLMLGDNAYDDGTDAQYQAAVFEMYATLLRNTIVWPTLGNHDANSADSPTESGVYYDVFTLPRGAEAGGVVSGTEAYYSFDHANVHFICLDSHDTDRSPGGAMMTWLQADLADTLADWIIAYWHHPPYTKGSHNSDNAGDSGGRMRDMRETALPILEAGGVDLVLNGHSHSYERSFLLDGHYGLSTTLTPEMILDNGDGRADGDGAYAKPAGGPASHEGAVYAVAGCAGKTSGGSLNHPAMFIAFNTLGSLVLDVSGDRLDAAFLTSTGVVADHFTILKRVDMPGDMNCDGGVDEDDIDPFFLALGNADTYAATYPDCDLAHADLNADGAVDAEDIDPFFECLKFGVCLP